MVGIVFVQPPAVTESEQQVGMNQPGDFIPGRTAENFLMARVVDDETQLRENKSQERGVAEFYPGIVKLRYQQKGANQQNKIEQHLSNIICGLLS
jgi:hypothetical protein